MSKSMEMAIWDGAATELVPAHLTQPSEIAEFAKQLTIREKAQVVKAYQDGSYEMATTFVWGRAIASLKRELGSLGITFLAEMLGRTDIREEDSVLDAITEKEAIRLAEELGIVSRTDAIRLRNSQELVSHFSQRDSSEDDDSMEQIEAVGILLGCVKSVLAKPKIQVAKRFAEFRQELENETFEPNDPRCESLVSAPYFFRRLSISVLLSGIRTHTGAKLEHCLSNLNLILPLLWPKLRDTEKWQIGTTYSQVHSDGWQAETAGLKQALLKVQGFDYVPENLRSQTFLKAAEAIIQAHEGMNNFYTEETPTLHLEKLGTVIPPPALGKCITALLCVRLGNHYGTSWSASPIAEKMLKRLSVDRWEYYINNVLPGETRILEKLQDSKPRVRWQELAKMFLTDVEAKQRTMKELLEASITQNENRISAAAAKLITTYYSGK